MGEMGFSFISCFGATRSWGQRRRYKYGVLGVEKEDL
jgi:hypothetical protein